MCGFYGQISDENGVDAAGGERALELIAHRGLDDRGVVDERSPIPLWIGHRRLSILDLSDAAGQPMSSADGRYLLAYNGEVYNFRELRSALGGAFETDGDTEVVLRACSEWGVASACRRFEGMFAFVLVDREAGEMSMARDTFGIKPCYYQSSEDGIVFGSELKCFSSRVGWDSGLGNRSRVTPESVMAMLTGAPHLCPESPWPGVGEVPPGTVVRWSASSPSRVAVERYRGLSDLVDPVLYRELDLLSPDAYDLRFQELFEQAVGRTLVSDAELGVGLSGGLDSTAVLAAASKIRGQEGVPKSYHADVVGHEGERPFAEKAASQLGSVLVSATVDPARFAASLARCTSFNDYPLGYHPNSIPFAHMTERASGEVKVLLTGEGADELLGGYGWIADMAATRAAAARRAKFHRLFSKVGLGGFFAPAPDREGDELERLRLLAAPGDALAGADWRSQRDLPGGVFDFIPPGDDREFSEQ